MINLRDVFRSQPCRFYLFLLNMAYATIAGAAGLRRVETIARCVGGAFAKMVLHTLGIKVTAYTSQVGNIALEGDYHSYDFTNI